MAHDETLGSYEDVLMRILAESCHVIGILAYEAGRFHDPAVLKALDNAGKMSLVHTDVLPFPPKKASSQPRWQGLTSGDWSTLRKKFDELLDFIYENGTHSEGVNMRLVSLVHTVELLLREKNAFPTKVEK